MIHAPASLPPERKSCLCPLDRRLGGPQSQSGQREQEKDVAMPRNSPEVSIPLYTDWAIQIPDIKNRMTKTSWPESASLLYRSLLVNEVSSNFADRRCHVVRKTDPYGRILAFLDWSRYFFFQVAPQLYSWGWVDPVADLLLLRKSGNDGNWTRITRSVAKNSDH
jgi:hypothetical protein